MIPDAALRTRIDAICARPIAELLPHRPPMLLLDEALGMDGEWFRAGVRIRPGIPFFAAGAVPAWVGLEYMAQAVGAYSGALGIARGGVPVPGMLLGTREYSAAVPAFHEGLRLEVRVRIDIFQDRGVSSMDCRIRSGSGDTGKDAGGGVAAEGAGTAAHGDPEDLARAQITVIESPDLRALLKEGSS